MSQVHQLSRSRRPKLHFVVMGTALIAVAVALTGLLWAGVGWVWFWGLWRRLPWAPAFTRILAEMGLRVFTIERHMSLMLVEARKHFEKFHYNIASKCGDGTLGWGEFAPYRGILVTAGAPEPPRALLEQLDEGGVLVIPVGGIEVQDIHIVTWTGGRFHTEPPLVYATPSAPCLHSQKSPGGNPLSGLACVAARMGSRGGR